MNINELTKSQCRNIADFIEDNLLQVIRNDTCIDNFGWLVDIVSAYEKLREGEKNDR